MPSTLCCRQFAMGSWWPLRYGVLTRTGLGCPEIVRGDRRSPAEDHERTHRDQYGLGRGLTAVSPLPLRALGSNPASSRRVAIATLLVIAA
jgi:hypothetical protein